MNVVIFFNLLGRLTVALTICLSLVAVSKIVWD